MSKFLTLKQLMKKSYKILDEIPEWFKDSFGEVVGNFKMIVWGESANGKSNFMMQIMQVLVRYGRVMYISLEEGHEKTMQSKALEYFSEADAGKLVFGNHEVTYDVLVATLSKKRSPKFIIIDSLQYWNITYDQYKELKARFSTKAFIFISHANGKMPDGKVANQVKYDAGIKIKVEGFIADVKSRYGGNKPHVIWEEGAKHYWGKDYKKKSTGIKPSKKTTKALKTENTEDEREIITEPEILIENGNDQ